MTSLLSLEPITLQIVKSFAIAVDPSGKRGWKENSIQSWNEYRTEDHIIESLQNKFLMLTLLI